jgi:methylated-DNA-[protein]-cysteine S-methyltransferase
MKDPIRTTMESPLGALTLTSTGGFLTGMTMEGQKHVPAPVPAGRDRPGDPDHVDDDPCFAEIKDQLSAYFGGTLTHFDLPVKLTGSDFQRRVWRCLQGVPYGETISYGELARRVGNPNASRAVGLANGRNPVAVIVPCHRVIGADGRLTGYAGGLDRKTWLLHHEAAVVTSPGMCGSGRG